MSTKNKSFKDVKKCSKIDLFVCLLESTYLREQFFSKPKYSKSKSRSRISDLHLYDTFCIAASIIEPNIAAIMQEKNQFHQHIAIVGKQRKQVAIHEREMMRVVFVFSICKIVRPTVDVKIENSPQHSESLGIAGLL